MSERRQKDVVLLTGTPACCTYAVDAAGFILFGLHNAGGDITSISEDEYDSIEAQCLGGVEHLEGSNG